MYKSTVADREHGLLLLLLLVLLLLLLLFTVNIEAQAIDAHLPSRM